MAVLLLVLLYLGVGLTMLHCLMQLRPKIKAVSTVQQRQQQQAPSALASLLGLVWGHVQQMLPGGWCV
jgi:hypothetical protein